MEPLGVVVFSVTMITSFAQVLVESVQRLFDKNLDVAYLPKSAIAAMASTVVVKLAVWFAYRSFKSPSVRALSQDAWNDVVFNTVSLIFPVSSLSRLSQKKSSQC
jgi:divalent metal cation (Fe/Co/Zn/Cd) transporter